MFDQCARAALVAGIALSIASAQSSAKVDFRKDVQPIFRANCYGCHGPTVQQNGFRLDRRADAMHGGTLAQIGPGNAAGSRLYLRLVGPQYGMQMPPTGALQPAQIEIIKRWIDQGADWPDDVSGDKPAAPPDAKAAALMTALRDDDLPAFRKALSLNSEAARRKGPGGSTPLMYATFYGGVDAMRLLLDKDADVNARNDAGATALMWGADDLAKVRLLVEHGADVNAASDIRRTALIIAAGIPGNTAVVKYLLDHGARADATAPALFGDVSPLSEAAYAGNEEIMRMLVDHGVEPNSAGPLALALSMRARCDGCVGLFAKSPSPKVTTPAMMFVSPPLGPGLGVPPLLGWGADPKMQALDGSSLLSVAAASETYPIETVKLLMEHGVDLNGKNATGETPLDLARRNGNTPMVEFLRKAGAKSGDAPDTVVPAAKPAATVRAAVERSLPMLQSNDATFLKKSGCVSCHNNTLTSITVAAASGNGFRVDDREVRGQLKTIGNYIDSWRERALQNQGIPGDADTVSYILAGLAAGHYPADPATDAMATIVKREQALDGHWRTLGHRPPIEASDIGTTAVSLRALQVYAPKARRAEYDKAIAMGAAWIAKAEPHSNEDRIYQLLGMVWTKADPAAIRKAAAALASEQRTDGGWSQIPSLASDAYATGEALVALQESGVANKTLLDRGIQFLMSTQAADGSWYVRRRVVPIQPYFESGFPYGRDQFISASATNWATTALALSSKL